MSIGVTNKWSALAVIFCKTIEEVFLHLMSNQGHISIIYLAKIQAMLGIPSQTYVAILS